MLNLSRYLKLSKSSLVRISRSLSISKSDLIESSQNIQELLQLNDSNNFSKWLYDSLNEIHLEYPSIKIGTSTKEIYEKSSSKLNSTFVQLENNRKKSIEQFEEENLIILLRYIRYLQVAFIYRLITYDINVPLKQISHSIINLTKNEINLNQNCLRLICELTFFVNCLSNNHSLSNVKSLLSSTLIVNYLVNGLLSKEITILLGKQICLTLYSIGEVPSLELIDISSFNLLECLYQNKCCSLKILKYLILLKHSSRDQSSSQMISLLNKYLIEICIYQEDLTILCQLLILINACHYSHQLFLKEIHQKIEKSLLRNCKEKKLFNDENLFDFDFKVSCRFIYYLCLNDPTNRFESRSIIVKLSQQLNENINKETKFAHWIVQAQHGMMLCNIYNYQLLSSTLQPTFLPFLFRDLGVYTLTIQRQLFDIHHVLSIDRPSRNNPLLNSQILSFASKISDEYRLSIRSNQKSYNKLLVQLNESLNEIYGSSTSKIINTNEIYPYLLFDFLQVNLPDNAQLRSIGINPDQRIAVLPILNSMLIKQQREDGSLVRVFSAHTTMRYRIIEKQNYQVLPIFHGEYLRAIRDNTIETLFQTTLAFKSRPKSV